MDSLHALWTDPDVRRYLWDDLTIPRGRAEETVLAAIESAERSGIGMWCLEPREGGALLGFCGLRGVGEADEVEVLYALRREHWGRGLATEAARAAVDWALEVHGLPRVLAGADRPNAASFAVMERLGMTPCAVPAGVPGDPLYYERVGALRRSATMKRRARRVAIAGAGIFGASTACALLRRGNDVTLLDPGPIPHPLAESTDISKIVRIDYGPDEALMALAERALEEWRRWSREWPEPPYHETGVLFLTREPWTPGGFEHESFRLLLARGHAPERLDAATIRARFPAFRPGAFVDGYLNDRGGFARASRVVEHLCAIAGSLGARIVPGFRAARILDRGGRVTGIADDAGNVVEADEVVVASGAWAVGLVPEIAGALRTTGQPVFHLRPEEPSSFRGASFPVFTADISRTGYYGFCANDDGIVKVARHGPGRPVHPDGPGREVTEAETEDMRAFLRDALPALAEAPLVATRICVYGDTWDEQFWIARHPERGGLTVATGGSGHAFKFAPLLGDLVADAMEGREGPVSRFRWRPDERPPGEEAARHRS